MWQSKYFHKETLTSSWLNATICLSQSDVPLEYHKPWNEPRLFSYLGRESIASRGILHGHKSKQRPREKLRVSPRSRKRPPNGSGVALHEATLIRGRGLPSPSLAPIRRAWWEHLATGTALGPWMLLDITAGLGATAGSTHPELLPLQCSGSSNGLVAPVAPLCWRVQPFNYTSTQNRSAVGNTLGSW